MSKKVTHHVVKSPDGGWDVKKGGATRKSGNFETKKEAVSWAREVSKNQGSELIIHKKDGRIQRTDSHGNDPMPPRDKK
jgi:uncharacterized protein YdaT